MPMFKGLSELTIDLLFMMLVLSISSSVLYSLMYVHNKELQGDSLKPQAVNEVRAVKLTGSGFKLVIVWSISDKQHTLKIVYGNITHVIQLKPYDVVIERIDDNITFLFVDDELISFEEVVLL